MNYRILVQNADGKPLEGASVTFTDSSGKELGLLKTNDTGHVSFDDDIAPEFLFEGTRVTASKFGYGSLSIDGASLEPDWYFTLYRNNMLLYGAIGAVAGLGGLLLLASTSAKKKVGALNVAQKARDAVSNPTVKKVLIYGGLGLGAYIAYKLLSGPGKGLGDLPTAADKAIKDLAANGIHPAITVAQAQAFSAELVAAFDDCGTDEDAVYSVMNALTNTADLMLLIKVYGVRSFHSCFGGSYFSDTAYNLATAIATEMDDSERAKVNELLANKGIQFTF